MSVFTPSFRPVSTIPPFRELAPHPIVSASNTTTLTPRRASARAAERPVNPLPMTATSAFPGHGRAASGSGIASVSIQNGFSLRDIGSSNPELAKPECHANPPSGKHGLVELFVSGNRAFERMLLGERPRGLPHFPGALRILQEEPHLLSHSLHITRLDQVPVQAVVHELRQRGGPDGDDGQA